MAFTLTYNLCTDVISMDIHPSPIWLKILDSSHNGILVIDNHGTIIVYNEAARSIFKDDHDKIVGRHLSEIRPEVWPDFQEIIRSGQPQVGKKLSLADATIITNRKPIVIDGEVVSVISLFQDISEYEQIISELQSYQKLHRELEAIFDSSYDGFYVADGRANTIRVNRRVEKTGGDRRI